MKTTVWHRGAETTDVHKDVWVVAQTLYGYENGRFVQSMDEDQGRDAVLFETPEGGIYALKDLVRWAYMDDLFNIQTDAR